MPRRANHSQQSYSQPNAIPQAHNAVPFMQAMQQPSHTTQSLQQRTADLHVQRSQGVIILSKNQAPQQSAPPPTTPASVPSLQFQQQFLPHQIPPAHHASMPMFNQHQINQMHSFMPTLNMQNPAFFYNLQNVSAASTGMTNSLTSLAPIANHHQHYGLNNGNSSQGMDTINYHELQDAANTMQAPPSPIKSKNKRRSRALNRVDSSESSDEEYVDSEDDPEWNPAGDEPQEPQFMTQRRTSTNSSPRGRRTSSGPRGGGARGGSRGRGARGRGRGRGRGSYQNSSPPTLVDQTAQTHSQIGGRQTRGSTLSMPSLDPQSSSQGGGQMSFGELVSQAVQSLADPDAGIEATPHPKKKVAKSYQKAIAALERDSKGCITLTRVPVAPNTRISLLIPVARSEPKDRDSLDDDSMEGEDEELIMAYEIVQDEDKLRPFMCETCGKTTRSRVLHNRHLVSHDSDLRFACCICSALFSDRNKLKPHLRTHHGSGIYVCPDNDCEGVFQERKSLDDHEFACHPDARRVVCKYCLDRFPTEPDAIAHEQAHGEDIDATCGKCGEHFDLKSEMDQHIIDMHEEKECQYCKEKFANKPALDDHQHEKHLELIKPPDPSPPSPQTPDSDPDYNPAADLDDDDDIVVVEERKRSPRVKPPPKSKAEPPASRPKSDVPIKPQPKKPEPQPKSILKTPTPGSKPGPGRPKSLPGKPSRPVKFAGSNDVITLSSDSEEEKDKTWRPSSSKKSKSSTYTPPARSKSLRHKAAEYVVIIESKADDDSSKEITVKDAKGGNQTLTFVMGENGVLKHLPSKSDSGLPDALPMKEIMEIIKSQNLSDNSTIVVEDNKISSVKPGSVQKPKIGPASKVKRFSEPVPIKRPAPGPVAARMSECSALKKSRPSSSNHVINLDSDNDSSVVLNPKSKPIAVTAKKRTGGLPRSGGERSDRVRDEDKERVKDKPSSGPIAKKRTGGSSSTYSKMDENNKHSENHLPERTRHPRKSAHAKPLADPLADDDDIPVIFEETYVDTVPPLPPPRPRVVNQPPKKGKKKGRSRLGPKSKSQARREKLEKLYVKQMDSTADCDGGAPKRSLRIALKASVTDTNYEEDGGDNGTEVDNSFVLPSEPIPKPAPPTKRKRGRPSTTTASANDGQVVMKAFVDGVWQDVVIGTKLTEEEKQVPPIPAAKLPIMPLTSQKLKPLPPAPRYIVTKKAGSGMSKTQQNMIPLLPLPRSSGRGGKRGRKPKNPAIDPWSDDRYQYFSGSNRPVPPAPSINPPLSRSGRAAANMSSSYGDPLTVDYSLGQDFAESDDTVMPFSLSSYMTYHHQESEPSPDILPPEQDDPDLPVIVNAYHVNPEDQFHNSNYSRVADPIGDDGDVDEIPMTDPLAMDDEPEPDPEPSPPSPQIEQMMEPEQSDEVELGQYEQRLEEPVATPSQQDEEEEEEEEEDEEEDEVPIAAPPQRPPPPPESVQKGTKQDATSALANLRSVLSMISFKKKD